jgi:hypothetical protein
MIASPAEDDSLPTASAVNTSYGCTSPGAALMCGNDPICVSERKILKWTSDTDELNECNAKSISDAVTDIIDTSFYSNASVYFDKFNDLLLFSDPTDSDGNLLIYAVKPKIWYRYSGIRGEQFISIGQKTAFTKGNVIYIFDENRDTDLLADGTERIITAELLTAPQDFSAPEAKKRLCGITVTSDLDESQITARFLSENILIASLPIEKSAGGTSCIKRRLNSKRFSDLSLSISAPGKGKVKIYSIGVWIKK